jgi:hypothetical protein
MARWHRPCRSGLLCRCTHMHAQTSLKLLAIKSDASHLVLHQKVLVLSSAASAAWMAIVKRNCCSGIFPGSLIRTTSIQKRQQEQQQQRAQQPSPAPAPPTQPSLLKDSSRNGSTSVAVTSPAATDEAGSSNNQNPSSSATLRAPTGNTSNTRLRSSTLLRSPLAPNTQVCLVVAYKMCVRHQWQFCASRLLNYLLKANPLTCHVSMHTYMHKASRTHAYPSTKSIRLYKCTYTI